MVDLDRRLSGAVLKTKVQTAGATTVAPRSKCLFSERCSLTATVPAGQQRPDVDGSRSEIESLDYPGLRGASRFDPDARGRDAYHVAEQRSADRR